MSANRLTQSALIQRLRDEQDIHVSPKTLKTWNLPTAPAAKKPRYIWEVVLPVILGQQAQHPAVKEALDARFKRRMKAS